MKHINFLEVGMKNYGPYIEEMILPLNQHNLSLVTGPNGIGKTMILDAIPFSLYGTTSKGKKGDDLVNNKVGKNCHTWLTFAIDDVPYRIDRYHKHSKYGNTVMLKKGDQELSKGQRELAPLIESLVVPQRLFMNTLFFGQSVKTFFTDLTDTDKKEIFRKILDLDKYTTYYEETTKRLKALDERKIKLINALSVKETLIPSFQKQIELILEEEKEFYKRKEMLIETYQKDISDYQKVIQAISPLLIVPSDDLLSTVNQQILECRSSLNSIKQEEEHENVSLTNAKVSKKNELTKKSQQMKEELRIENAKQFDEVSIEYDTKIQELNNKAQEIQDFRTKEEISSSSISFKINSLDTQASDLTVNVLTLSICPTCLQTLDDEKKKNLKNKIQELIQEKQKLEEQMKSSYSKKNELTQKHLEIKNELTKLAGEKHFKVNEQKTILTGKFREVDAKEQSILEELKSRSDQAETEIRKKYMDKKSSLERILLSLLSDKQKYESQIEEQKKIKESIDEKKAKIDSLIKTIEEKRKEVFDKKRIESVEEKIKLIKDEIKLLHEQQQLVYKQEEVLNFWKVGFSSSGIPSLLIDESIPFMNNRVSYYLDKISNGRYTVSFDTLQATKAGEFRDKISVNVLDNISKANSRVQLSGGQTRIVDIATILTLCDLQSNVQNVTFNLLLFDEIFDSLDDENIGFVSKVLKELAKEKSLFIISHRYIDQIEADNVISLR
jgi:DNA repair exonuclease SbcCD ATPase subunit